MPEGMPRADVLVRAKGRVHGMIEYARDSFKSLHPDKEVSLTYHPEEKKKYSKVIERRLAGYKPVTNEEAGLDEIYGAPQDPVRIGDTILMAADAELVGANKAKKAYAAQKDANRSADVYIESVEKAARDAGAKQGKGFGTVKRTVTEYEKSPLKPEE